MSAPAGPTSTRSTSSRTMRACSAGNSSSHSGSSRSSASRAPPRSGPAPRPAPRARCPPRPRAGAAAPAPGPPPPPRSRPPDTRRTMPSSCRRVALQHALGDVVALRQPVFGSGSATAPGRPPEVSSARAGLQLVLARPRALIDGLDRAGRSRSRRRSGAGDTLAGPPNRLRLVIHESAVAHVLPKRHLPPSSTCVGTGCRAFVLRVSTIPEPHL
jgi:hypothetical protein